MYYFGLRTKSVLYWAIALILMGSAFLGYKQGSLTLNDVDFEIILALPWWINGIFFSAIILASTEVIGLLERVRRNTEQDS